MIEWRGWFDWVRSFPNGAEWLENFKDETVHAISVPRGKKSKKPKGLPKKFPIPDDWTWGGDHWNIARHMTDEHYRYLLSLPLILHLPSLHSHVVHAGLLPLDPTRSTKSRHQPLSHLPLMSAAEDGFTWNTTALRIAQEIAVIKEM